jgi:uncharacterized protein (TIGR02300 family)
MPAKDFGSKHTCVSCSAKFYDLKKPDPVCPKCGTDQRAAQAARPPERKSRLSAVPKIVETIEPEVEASDEDEADEDADEVDDADAP